MLNATRAQLYRMLHGSLLWVCLAIIVLPIAASAVAMAVIEGNEMLAGVLGVSGEELQLASSEAVHAGTSTSSDFARLIGSVDSPETPFALYGATFVNGSFIAMVAAGFAGVFVAQDMRSGKQACYAKNLVQARGGRLAYAASLMVASVVAGAAFVIAAIAATVLFFAAAGFAVVPPSLAEFVLWAAQVWAIVVAYQLIAALAALATRSEVVGVIAGVLLGGFTVESALFLAIGALASQLGPAAPLALAADAFADGSLMARLSSLGHGALCPPELFATAVVVAAVAAALCLAVARRRDLS